jgi:hypothetical protein
MALGSESVHEGIGLAAVILLRTMVVHVARSLLSDAPRARVALGRSCPTASLVWPSDEKRLGASSELDRHGFDFADIDPELLNGGS